MYSKEMEPAAALGTNWAPSLAKPLKVEAIISEKAAITNRENNQEKIKNN